MTDKRYMPRREFLATGAAAASAGCIGTGSNGDDTTPTPDTPEDGESGTPELTPTTTPTPEPASLSENDVNYGINPVYSDHDFLEEGDEYRLEVEVKRTLENNQIDDEGFDDVEGLLNPENYSINSATLYFKEYNEDMEITNSSKEVNVDQQGNNLVIPFNEVKPGEIWLDLELEINDTINYGNNQTLEVNKELAIDQPESQTGYIIMPWQQKQQHLNQNLNQIDKSIEEAFFERRQIMRNQVFEDGGRTHEEFGDRLDVIKEKTRDVAIRANDIENPENKSLEELFTDTNQRYTITGGRWVTEAEDIIGGGDTSAFARLLAWTNEEFYEEDTWSFPLGNRGHNTALHYNQDEDLLYHAETSAGNAGTPPRGASFMTRYPDRTPLMTPSKNRQGALSTKRRAFQTGEHMPDPDQFDFDSDFSDSVMDDFADGEFPEELQKEFQRLGLTYILYPDTEFELGGSSDSPEISVGEEPWEESFR